MSKYTVEYTTVNPAYNEGRKMWRAVTVLTVVITLIAIIF